MKACRILVIVYAAAVVIAGLWAWYVEVALIRDPRDHLLPAVVLLVVALPASLSTEPLYDVWPGGLSKPLVQLTWVTLFGVGQVALLWLACRSLSARAARALDA